MREQDFGVVRRHFNKYFHFYHNTLKFDSVSKCKYATNSLGSLFGIYAATVVANRATV